MTPEIVAIAESLFDNGEWILGVFFQIILSQNLKSDQILNGGNINSCQERMSAGCIFTVIVYHDSKLLQSRE
jgi:hypothetical protein